MFSFAHELGHMVSHLAKIVSPHNPFKKINIEGLKKGDLEAGEAVQFKMCHGRVMGRVTEGSIPKEYPSHFNFPGVYPWLSHFDAIPSKSPPVADTSSIKAKFCGTCEKSYEGIPVGSPAKTIERHRDVIYLSPPEEIPQVIIDAAIRHIDKLTFKSD